MCGGGWHAGCLDDDDGWRKNWWGPFFKPQVRPQVQSVAPPLTRQQGGQGLAPFPCRAAASPLPPWLQNLQQVSGRETGTQHSADRWSVTCCDRCDLGQLPPLAIPIFASCRVQIVPSAISVFLISVHLALCIRSSISSDSEQLHPIGNQPPLDHRRPSELRG